jgi:hypothetical protein
MLGSERDKRKGNDEQKIGGGSRKHEMKRKM